MNKLKKLAVAVLAVAGLAGLAGCATNQATGLPKAGATPAAEQQVLRALPSYGSMGGYRYRRFAAVNAPA